VPLVEDLPSRPRTRRIRALERWKGKKDVILDDVIEQVAREITFD
jgi:hypothetical protein